MPAITRWSRSIGCRWRGSSIRRASSSSGGAGQASGPSVATISSPSTSPARMSFAQARCLVPNSRRRSSRPSPSRISTRAVRSRSEARFSNTWRRPADIRWTSRASGSAGPAPSSAAAGPSNSTTGIFPIRRTAAIRRPVRTPSGGSTLFSATIPGACADSTSTFAREALSRRAVISTSGSSGISQSLRTSEPSPVPPAGKLGGRSFVWFEAGRQASRAGEHRIKPRAAGAIGAPRCRISR